MEIKLSKEDREEIRMIAREEIRKIVFELQGIVSLQEKKDFSKRFIN